MFSSFKKSIFSSSSLGLSFPSTILESDKFGLVSLDSGPLLFEGVIGQTVDVYLNMNIIHPQPLGVSYAWEVEASSDSGSTIVVTPLGDNFTILRVIPEVAGLSQFSAKCTATDSDGVRSIDTIAVSFNSVPNGISNDIYDVVETSFTDSGRTYTFKTATTPIYYDAILHSGNGDVKIGTTAGAQDLLYVTGVPPQTGNFACPEDQTLYLTIYGGDLGFFGSITLTTDLQAIAETFAHINQNP